MRSFSRLKDPRTTWQPPAANVGRKRRYTRSGGHWFRTRISTRHATRRSQHRYTNSHMKTARLYLFDPNLKNAGGHYLGYATRVAQAAEAVGIATVIVGNAQM